MHYFNRGSKKLSSLSPGLRRILVFYLFSTLLAFWLSGLKYVLRGLLLPGSIRAYYLGTGEDQLLGGEAGKSLSFLVDVTHPHLFTVPLVLMVLAHLLQLCAYRQRLKNTIYLSAFTGFVLTFAGPWIVPLAPGLALLIPIGGTVLLLAGSLLCLLPLLSLLKGERPRNEG
ncbi:MAG TPA: hypothetical protein ENK02_10250 [Planctomycetes bacterium]|nr:hypothetical protein [Planctomycetota bacterium]